MNFLATYMVEREQIISFLKNKGPSVPNDVKRALGGDTMIFGAMLSELSTRGSVLITNVKKGSSPFYYLPGQEQKLEKLVEFCNPKDQKTIALLKEKKVLRDKSLELFARVSLRQVKDFAKELQVNTAKGMMIFWRYYLISEEDAIEILKKHYNNQSEKKSVEQPVVQPKKIPVHQPKEIILPIIKKQEFTKEKTEHEKIIVAKEKNIFQTNIVSPTESSSFESNSLSEHQQPLPIVHPLDKSEFHSEILRYFSKINIQIIYQEQLTKNRDYEFVVMVPSAVGSMEMYCRARNKKKLTEGDVAPALLKAKIKDLPCIFLSNGDFSKKSLQVIDKEYKGLILKKL